MKTFDSGAKENIHPNRGDIVGPKPFRTTFSPFEEAEEYQMAKPSYHSTAESSKSKPVTTSSQASQNITARPNYTHTSAFAVSKQSQGNHKSGNVGPSQQLKSVAVQSTFADEDIFPVLDYRRCTRCGKNDAISPGVCHYKNRSVSHADHSDMIKFQSKDKVAYTHVYKEDHHQADGDLIFFKPAHEVAAQQNTPCSDAGVQTIVGLAQVRLMNRGPLQEFRYVEKILLSPKD